MPKASAQSQAAFLQRRYSRYAAGVIKHPLGNTFVRRSDHLLQHLSGAFKAVYDFAGNTRGSKLAAGEKECESCENGNKALHSGLRVRKFRVVTDVDVDTAMPQRYVSACSFARSKTCQARRGDNE